MPTKEDENGFSIVFIILKILKTFLLRQSYLVCLRVFWMITFYFRFSSNKSADKARLKKTRQNKVLRKGLSIFQTKDSLYFVFTQTTKILQNIFFITFETSVGNPWLNSVFLGINDHMYLIVLKIAF